MCITFYLYAMCTVSLCAYKLCAGIHCVKEEDSSYKIEYCNEEKLEELIHKQLKCVYI